MKRTYIIYAPDYDECIGGSIVLHRLCDLLNKSNQTASLWPFSKPIFSKKNPLKSIIKIISYWIRKRSTTLLVNDKFNTPIAVYQDLKNSIVIYPEMIDGNPLYNKNTVRWLLNKPGFFTNSIHYSKDDMFFYYQKSFCELPAGYTAHHLQTIYVRHDIYYNKNHKNRQGSCYMMRKGNDRTIIHDIRDSVCIDDLSHSEVAEIFNSVEYFISYDLYTMYSRYAALCGCISVVAPKKGLSKKNWKPESTLRNGIAYGFDDITHAKETSKYVLQDLKQQEEDINKSVNDFISLTQSHFKSD